MKSTISFLLGLSFFSLMSLWYLRDDREPVFQLIEKSNQDEFENWIKEYQKRDKRLIVYNRVGKCGSTSMLKIIDHLQSKKKLIHSQPGLKYWGHAGQELMERWLNLTRTELKRWEKWNGGISVIIEGHAAWIDYEAYGIEKPIYINVLREPVSRMRSIFYYMHSPVRHGSNESAIELANLFGDHDYDPEKHTLSNCLVVSDCFKYVLTKYAEQPIRQFTPMLDHTRPPSPFPVDEKTLSTIIKVLEEEYYLVLILEDLDYGLRVLECFLPDQFGGALDIFKTESDDEQRANENLAGNKPKEENWDRIAQLVYSTGEVTLYRHAVAKFCRTWKYAKKQCPQLGTIDPPSCA